MKILVNHIGYNSSGIKKAVLAMGAADSPEVSSDNRFNIRNTITGLIVFSGIMEPQSEVAGWKGRTFRIIDLTELLESGTFRIEIPDMDVEPSFPFKIEEGLWAEETISDILFYYKAQRSSWVWDEYDKNVPFFGERGDGKKSQDAHGGWFDASGDYSKYLSHLSYANYLNPQQTPLVAWSLLNLSEALDGNGRYGSSLLKMRALEEGLWGADFLMRMQDDAGYFYMTVFDQWDKAPEKRMICAYRGMDGTRLSEYQAGFRQGGGLSIAALAAAARITAALEGVSRYRNDPVYGGLTEFSIDDYLSAAVKGYSHLVGNNTAYLDNGRENIIDFYCGLTAATELYVSTREDYYLDESRRWADLLASCYSTEEGYFLIEPDADRPYFHASDAGLPLLSLVNYIKIESNRELKIKTLTLVENIVQAELKMAFEVQNPFFLARQRVKPVGGEAYTSFFIPHNNESGYWWQGENARLGSLSAAMRSAAGLFRRQLSSEPGMDELLEKMEGYADAQLNWILGLNPFDICMLQGHGRNNPKYEDQFPNAPGGICNGITSGFEDESDIDFLPESVANGGDHRWRWSEQWIPHAAWFLSALTLDKGNWKTK
ncbi:MAG: glycoside hydrolase family 9 protein [Spirochaetales bacterium]|nr:glycoside hydrolase family 9 protein [Spirochaetales bacterium]